MEPFTYLSHFKFKIGIFFEHYKFIANTDIYDFHIRPVWLSAISHTRHCISRELLTKMAALHSGTRSESKSQRVNFLLANLTEEQFGL